jgi:ribosomal protein S18 acetylase RimI-like enzyme
MRIGNDIIGTCVFGQSFTDGYLDDGEISAIYLSHDCIGKGYGHALFAESENRLLAKGYTHIVLDVLSGNKRAVAFYRTHGYENVKDATIRLGNADYPLTMFRKRIKESKA